MLATNSNFRTGVARAHAFRLPGARSTCARRRARVVAAGAGADSGPADVFLHLARSYWTLQNPAAVNTLYSKVMTDFTESAVLAYECGHSEGDMVEQLERLPQSELARLQGFEPAECVALVSLVWITLQLSPRSVKRWASAPPVTEATLSQWRGFVALIVNAYFERRAAWYPLDRLSLELTAVQGRTLPQELVAERARVVFQTLEQVYPQFAKD